jgi:hypothetical protein
MIRIVDEKIFSLTSEQNGKLRFEFQQDPANWYATDSDFEYWLETVKHIPHTTYREENP